MNSEPNWLDIQEQLYPQIYISKTIRVHIEQQVTHIREPIHYDTQVLYNSLHREINITSNLCDLIANFFNTGVTYNVFLFHSQSSEFVSVATYPFKQPVLLQGAFVQDQFLIVRLEEVGETANLVKPKIKTDKNIKFVLQKVAKWRKIHIDSQKKITLEEAANMIGISRNTLDDYYFQIKLAQKYGFNFHEKLQEPFQSVRKFVKQNQQKKKNKQPNLQPNILSKYQLK